MPDYVVHKSQGEDANRPAHRGEPDATSPKGKWRGATLIAASSGQKSESADLESANFFADEHKTVDMCLNFGFSTLAEMLNYPDTNAASLHW